MARSLGGESAEEELSPACVSYISAIGMRRAGQIS